MRDKKGRFIKGIRQSTARVFSKGHIPWNKERSWSQEVKNKISINRTGKGLHKGTAFGGFKTQFKAGIKHPNYQGGATKYNLTKGEWLKIQKRIKERNNFTCQKCQKQFKSRELNVHHKKPYKISKDNSDDNLITYCIPCHIKEEWKIQKNPKI